jgi:succinate dehydrogenase / fumarate reductase membrane anchor subunit
MSRMTTPRKRVRGFGAAGTGTGHFLQQRVSAIALFVLMPVFVISFALSGAPDADATRAWLGSPFGALVTLLTMSAALYHGRLGVQVVIEDYIHKTTTKAALLIANTFLVAGLWLAGVYALLTLAL